MQDNTPIDCGHNYDINDLLDIDVQHLFICRFDDCGYRNNSYEITIDGFQVRNINEIRNVIFGLRYEKPSSALRPKLGYSPS